MIIWKGDMKSEVFLDELNDGCDFSCNGMIKFKIFWIYIILNI